jgi:hypothetical protein
MSATHGSKAVIKIDDNTGTPVDVSQYLGKFSMPRQVETAEVTTFGKTSKVRIAGLKDGKATAEGPWDAVTDALFASILGKETVTLDYSPAGVASGSRNIKCEAILTSYEPSSDVGSENQLKAEFELTGDATIGTNP